MTMRNNLTLKMFKMFVIVSFFFFLIFERSEKYITDEGKIILVIIEFINVIIASTYSYKLF